MLGLSKKIHDRELLIFEKNKYLYALYFMSIPWVLYLTADNLLRLNVYIFIHMLNSFVSFLHELF